jgi:hypothetical protein
MTAMLTQQKPKPRAAAGSALAEFGPAFMLSMLLLFFPLFDYLGMALCYGSGAVLNFNCVREASLVRNAIDANGNSTIDQTKMEDRVKRVQDDWQAHGFGQFIKLNSPIATDVQGALHDKVTNPNGDDYVTVRQTLVVNPFLMIPFFPISVPGINAPMTFRYSSQRMVENG